MHDQNSLYIYFRIENVIIIILFFYFLFIYRQLLPFIEESCPTPLAKLDICVEMPLMNSYFKFHWLPHYNDTYYELLRSWIDEENPDFPNYLVIGNIFGQNKNLNYIKCTVVDLLAG